MRDFAAAQMFASFEEGRIANFRSAVGQNYQREEDGHVSRRFEKIEPGEFRDERLGDPGVDCHL